MDNKPLITIENISKAYPGVLALDDVSMSFYPGKLHAIAGENGCGKSTLARIIAGIEKCDKGCIRFNNKEISKKHNVKQAERAGIVMLHQDPLLIKDLTVWENVFVGHEKTILPGFPCLDIKKMQNEAKRILSSLPMNINIYRKADTLNLCEQHIVQFARALIINPKVLVIDELSIAFTLYDMKVIYQYIRAMLSQGTSVIYISHDINELLSISDDMTILKDGRIVQKKDTSHIDPNRLVKTMLGKDIKDQYPKLPNDVGEESFRVYNLSNNYVKDIGFSLHKGEILGFVGLAGSGRTCFARTIVGLEKKHTGRFFVNGEEVSITNPRDAQKYGIAYLSETRTKYNLFNKMSVLHNVSIKNLDNYTDHMLINPSVEKTITSTLLKKMGVKNVRLSDEVSHISGGNQQKILMARCFLSNTNIFIFDEPTRGVDIQGKVEIYNLFNEITRRGGSIIIISSNISEAIGMSNRIIVMNKGRMVCELNQKEASQERVFHYASHGLSSTLPYEF